MQTVFHFDFHMYSRFGHHLNIEITGDQVIYRLSRDDTIIEEKIFHPDQEKLDVFLAGMENSGVFEWEDHYNECCSLDGVSWSLKINTGNRTRISRGTNGYPPGWPLFLAALESILGTVLKNLQNHILHG